MERQHATIVNDVATVYHADRIAAIEAEQAHFKKRSNLVSIGRGATFLATCAAIYLGLAGTLPPVVAYLLGGLAVAAFIGLVWYYDWLGERQTSNAMRLKYHRHQVARSQRRWDAVPRSGIQATDAAAIVSRDLDLFGDRSLCELLAETHTPSGKLQLQHWLCHPASIEVICQRQDAVRWLTLRDRIREDYSLSGRLLADENAKTDELVEWGQQPGWLAQRRWITWVTLLASGVTVLLVAGVLTQVLPAAAILVFYGMLVFHVLFNAFFTGPVHDIFNRVSASAQQTHHYSAMFQTLWRLPGDVLLFREIQSQLGASADEFHEALTSLRRWIALGSGRRSGAFSLFYFLGQIFFFWDYHVLLGLERWQRKHGRSLAGWFEAVGTLEVLCSFSGLARINPTWQYPDVANHDPAVVVEARELGHPLLNPAICVTNDVAVGPPGRFLFITGSNMSGKSTLLRSLGLNIMLAQAGSVVCAKSMRLKPVRVETSVRVDDSLADGTSFFMAELKRLKTVVDVAQQCADDPNIQLFFLLDEILQGTNSKERHIAVEHILNHLVEMRATGAVTTHDIELCYSDVLKNHCDTAHFRESFATVDGRQKMTFDYQLRDGVCPTTNALKLLELVGLMPRD